MAHPPRRRVGSARALVTLVVLLAATACGGGGADKPAATPQASAVPSVPADPPVEVIGLPDDVEFEVTGTVMGVENSESLAFVSPVYTLSPAGPLGSPVTVRLRLDNALAATSAFLVATRKSSDQPWGYVPGRLTSDQRHVDYNATSLDEVGALVLDVDGALSTFQEDLRAGLATGINRKAEKPTCADEKGAREDGYTVAGSKTKTLFWCFGLEGGNRVVKVTNRRPIPIEVAHPEIPVISDPPAAKAWAPWFRALGTENTLLAPGRTATYNADLEPKTTLLLKAESLALGQSMRLLQAGVRALVLSLDRFGTAPPKVPETVGAFLEMPQCAASLSKGGVAVIAGCFSKPKLTRVFGSEALLVAPLLADPSVRLFVRQRAKAISVEASTTDLKRIGVRRAAPDFSAFTGLWSGKSRLLSITDDGVATELVTDDTGARIIQLTYQLEDPQTGAAASSAKARVTAVKVDQRKLIDGRVPRRGDTGTVRADNGIVTPPFLKTRYCNPEAAKRGRCGS